MKVVPYFHTGKHAESAYVYWNRGLVYMRREALEIFHRWEGVVRYDASADWNIYCWDHTREESLQLMTEYLPILQKRLTVADPKPEQPSQTAEKIQQETALKKRK